MDALEGSAQSGEEHARSFAARLRAKYGEGVDPEVSLDVAAADAVDEAAGRAESNASSELLRRLADHSLKESRYKLDGEIARGGMGAILRVWDEDLRRALAMKVILGRTDVSDARSAEHATPAIEPRQLARFLEEAQVTGQLDHPGIVPVHELGLDQDGRVYFTMKLVKGRDLKAVFDLVFSNADGWNQTRALSVILRACEAMAYAHKKGVIHRDLKPANVMVGNFGEVYVMDWGLARVLGQEDRHDIRIAPEFQSSLASVKTERREEREELSDSPIMTMDGDVMGTPAYMSPEQARGEIERLGPRSDVYSMGALLYHLLARRAPYTQPGARVSNRTVLAMVLNGPPTKLSTLRKDVPAELAAICEKAMSRDASQRYADTLAFAEDLRAYLEHRVVGAYETGTWAETKKWVQRNKPLAASLAAAVLLLVVGLTASLVFKARADENALLASQRADETAEQARIAKSNEERALANERRAQSNEARAVAGERLATQKTNDVLSLSAIQELKELVDQADALWPAHTENIAAYEGWLAKANVLIDGDAGDPARGIAPHPSRVDHESKLARIRLRAKPLTAEQIEADRRATPRFAEWERSRAKLTWMRRMLGEEPWPSEASVELELARETLPADANALNRLAWKLVDVDPAKVVYGSELRGLSLARRAVGAAKEGERGGIRDTLGWALYRCGRLDEALAEEERAVDEAQGKQKDELAASLERMRELVGRWKPVEAGTSAARSMADELSALSSRVSELEGAVNERRTFEFEDAQDRWWHAQLSQLVSDLRSFTEESSGGLFSSGVSPERGWGIVKRADFARTIEERSVSGADAKRRWEDAIASIRASPQYRGMELLPQLGLLPVGADPDSGLWEFAHLQTGEPAQRGTDGKLVLTESMGLVLVLVPGGTFLMGAQSTDPTGANYDPQARNDESPVHEVTLSPYFLSKYEMTQGQWLRFVGRNPSNYGPGSEFAGHQHNLLHPVEQVTWTQCVEVMARLGLSLPSEAQWENGCRAGTDSPWWTGIDRESLRGNANLADQSAARAGATWQDIEDWPDLDDGWAVHAAIGSFPPNAFGLHEVHGNVWEWCADGYDAGFYRRGPAIDPVAPIAGAQNRVNRGGSFYDAAVSAHSAYRLNNTPEGQFSALGLRPARASQLSTSPLHPK